MNKLIEYIKSHFSKFYELCRKNKILTSLIWNIYLIEQIYKCDKKLLLIFIKKNISYYIFWNKKDITLNFYGQEITIPGNMKWLWYFIATRNNWAYNKISWCKHVLDLWGFLWDTALKFALANENVTVYEADPTNFKYLLLNTKKLKNINAFNYGVTWLSTTKLKFYWGHFNWGSSIYSNENNFNNYIEIPAINIIDILNKWDFDALKMDIEWEEYNCFESIIKSGNFYFKKWLIEFHKISSDNMYCIKKLNQIIKRLNKNWYSLEFYLENIDCIKMVTKEEALFYEAFLLYFYK